MAEPEKPEKVDEALRNALFAPARPKKPQATVTSPIPSPTPTKDGEAAPSSSTSSTNLAAPAPAPALSKASEFKASMGDSAQRLMTKLSFVAKGASGGDKSSDDDRAKAELLAKKDKSKIPAPSPLPPPKSTEAVAAAAVAAANAAAAAAAASFFNDTDELEAVQSGILDVDAALDSVLGDIEGNADENDLDEVEELLKDRLTQFQEDPMVKDALKRGVDLRQYAKQIEEELVGVEKLSVEDYIRQGPQLEALNQQIQTCDAILATMETMLRGFQGDLGSISDEIQVLQNQSVSMNYKIRNRKAVQADLGNFLDDLIIPKDLARAIFDSEINEQYAAHLAVLDKKLLFVREHESPRTPAVDTIQPELDRLRVGAAERIRDFLLEKIKILRRPKSNPAIQQQALLKHKALYAFVAENHPPTSRELLDTYVLLMKDYYFRSFSKYIASTMKLVQPAGDKNEVLAGEETQKKSFFGQLGGRIAGSSSSQQRSALLVLGDRVNVLRNIESDILLAHVAEENHQRFPFEVLFRSQARLLMDNASSEFLFILEFFGVKGDGAQDIFTAIFDTSIALSLTTLRGFLDECYDAIGVLLCIRINMEHQRIMMHRRVPCLDQYVNQVNMSLWPRFQRLLDRHLISVRNMTPANWGSLDVTAHPICRRYGDFVSSILLLSENQNLEPVNSSLSRLRFEMENLLLRMSAEFADRRKYLIFLINNYDSIVTSLMSDPNPSAVEAEKEAWNKHLTLRTNDFVSEELGQLIGNMIQFVKSAESDPELRDVEDARFEVISSDFASHWKQILAKINNSVGAAFQDQQMVVTILQHILKQLLMTYSGFLTLIEMRFGRNVRPPFRQEVVSLEQLRFEIKKLRPGAA